MNVLLKKYKVKGTVCKRKDGKTGWIAIAATSQSCDFLLIEDNLIFFVNGRQPQFIPIGRWPQCLSKWKTTSICRLMEDNLNF